MTDDELMEWVSLSLRNRYMAGDVSGDQMAETVLNARTAMKSLNAAKAASAYTRDLAKSTKNLAVGTWAIAIITLVTQLSLLMLAFKR
jgi:hypothetical protein